MTRNIYVYIYKEDVGLRFSEIARDRGRDEGSTGGEKMRKTESKGGKSRGCEFERASRWVYIWSRSITLS